jgi:hypothetical protein
MNTHDIASSIPESVPRSGVDVRINLRSRLGQRMFIVATNWNLDMPKLFRSHSQAREKSMQLKRGYDLW